MSHPLHGHTNSTVPYPPLRKNPILKICLAGSNITESGDSRYSRFLDALRLQELLCSMGRVLGDTTTTITTVGALDAAEHVSVRGKGGKERASSVPPHPAVSVALELISVFEPSDFSGGFCSCKDGMFHRNTLCRYFLGCFPPQFSTSVISRTRRLILDGKKKHCFLITKYLSNKVSLLTR